MFDVSKILTIAIQGGSFIAVMAAIVAGVIMAQVTKKFGTGILANGFKSISWGVFFIAAGILVDSVQSYILISSSLEATTVLLLAKEILFVTGTYIIVIGSKKTGDKLESLTK